MRLSPAIQLKLSYLLGAIVFALALVISQPVAAQDGCDLDDAQDWYDSLDENDIIQTALTVSADNSQRMTDRAKAPAALEVFYDTIEGLDYPECVEDAREQYLEAIQEMQVATESLINATTAGDYGEFAILFGAAMESMGEFRGHLQALGVEVYKPDGATLFFK